MCIFYSQKFLIIFINFPLIKQIVDISQLLCIGNTSWLQYLVNISLTDGNIEFQISYMMLIDVVIEFIIHALNYMVSNLISFSGFDLIHVFFTVLFKIPSNNCNDIFLIIYSYYLDNILLDSLYQLYNFSIVSKSKVYWLKKLIVLLQNLHFKDCSIFLCTEVLIWSRSSKLEIISAIYDNQIIIIAFCINIIYFFIF